MGYGNGMNRKPVTSVTKNSKKPMTSGTKNSKSNKLSEKQMEKLREHSKLHKGGLRSRHIQNMKKFMIAGDSFSKSHSKAVKLDKK